MEFYKQKSLAETYAQNGCLECFVSFAENVSFVEKPENSASLLFIK